MGQNNEQDGIVVEVSGSTAKIRASRHNNCATCGACPGNTATVLEVFNPLGARVGQKVVIKARGTNMLKAAFTVYIFPLIAVFFGAVAGAEIAAWAGLTDTWPLLIGGIGAFLAAIWYVKNYEYSVRTDVKMKPVITQILSS